mgnify:FL=1
MKFSIIIPTYNESHNLKELVKYLRQSDIENFDCEIIVADANTSTESHHELDSLFTYLPTNTCGRAKQMNAGAAKAQGDILIFLHADVKPPLSFLNDIAKSIDQGYPFGFFAYHFHPTNWILGLNAWFTKYKSLFSGGGDQIHFFTKELFHQLDGYNEKFVIMEDFHMMSKIKKQQIPYVIIQNQALVSARKYAKNSWFKVNFANLVAFSLFLLNIDPLKIKATYERLLRK